jgi:hypothetical protein
MTGFHSLQRKSERRKERTLSSLPALGRVLSIHRLSKRIPRTSRIKVGEACSTSGYRTWGASGVGGRVSIKATQVKNLRLAGVNFVEWMMYGDRIGPLV